jgi:hypothetical protein
MPSKTAIIPVGRIESRILLVRGEKVIIDADLAKFYGVRTKRLNEQVKRNRHRFPRDFMFQLTTQEKMEVVANCDYLSRLKFSKTRPYAFTEHGAIMVASVLNTPRAVEVSVFIVLTCVYPARSPLMNSRLINMRQVEHPFAVFPANQSPPVVVRRIVPASPTAVPVLASVKETPASSLLVPLV